MKSLILEGEYLEDLQREGLKIIQPVEGYRFSADAVILAHFAGGYNLKGIVADLGTGSGIILFLLSALCPEASFIGLELQPDMAGMARRSVQLNKLESRIEIIQGDIRDVGRYAAQGSMDAVVCNPPFIAKDAGPANAKGNIALSRQEWACSLEDVFAAAARLLKNKGKLFLVHKPGRLADLCCWGRQYRLELKRLRLVMPKPGGEPSMVLANCVKDAAPGMEVLTPLVLTNGDGTVSEEARKIYEAEE